MAVTLHQTDIDYVRSATQALRAVGPAPGGLDILTNAAILGLATVDALVLLVNVATPRKTLEDEFIKRCAIENIRRLQNYGVLDDQAVIDSDTFAGLVTQIYTKSGIADSDKEVEANHYGGEQYLGNASQSVI